MKRVYKALLNQSGTDAPVATVLENTFCGMPQWGYIDVGYYSLSLTNAFSGNVTVKIGNEGNTEISSVYFSEDKTNDQIQIFVSYSGNLGNGNNDVLVNTSIEVEVYN